MAVKRLGDDLMLFVIEDFQYTNGFAPTYRELADACEMAVSAIGYRIKQLRKEGLLEDAHATSARTLVLSRSGKQLARQYRERAAQY